MEVIQKINLAVGEIQPLNVTALLCKLLQTKVCDVSTL